MAHDMGNVMIAAGDPDRWKPFGINLKKMHKHGGLSASTILSGIDVLGRLTETIGNQVDQGRRTTAEIDTQKHNQGRVMHPALVKLMQEGKLSKEAIQSLTKHYGAGHSRGFGDLEIIHHEHPDCEGHQIMLLHPVHGGNPLLAAAAAGDVVGKLTESIGNQVDQGRRTTAELDEMSGVADTKRLQQQAERARLAQREFDRLQNERFWGYDTFVPRKLRLSNFGFTDKWQVRDPNYKDNLARADDALEAYINSYIGVQGGGSRFMGSDHAEHFIRGHGMHRSQESIMRDYPNPNQYPA
jgi:hypothetical protein